MRINKRPPEHELDGVCLDNMQPGTVREVSPSIGTWLIAERYAELEMRNEPTHEEDFLVHRPKVQRDCADDCPRRRRDERRRYERG